MNSDRNEMSPEDAGRLADYLDGRLAGAVKEKFEAEILSRPELAAVLYEDVGITTMLEEADGAAAGPLPLPVGPPSTSLRPPGTGRRRRWLRVVIPLAAALALLFLAPPLLRIVGDRDPETESGSDFRFRSPESSAPAVPRGLSPRGTLDSPPERFAWSRDPAATTYRFELLSGDGRTLYSAVVEDTLLILPPGAVAWSLETETSWMVSSRSGTSTPVTIRMTGR